MDKTRVIQPVHQCETAYSMPITVFDLIGRQHQCNIKYCHCMSKVETLIQCGLWPSSPVNPESAVDLNLMEMCKFVQLEAYASLEGFSSSIMEMHRYNVFNVHKVMVWLWSMFICNLRGSFTDKGYSIFVLVWSDIVIKFSSCRSSYMMYLLEVLRSSSEHLIMMWII